MDPVTATGLACIIGAIVGGGLKAFGVIELPALNSLLRQLLLGIVGILLISAPHLPHPQLGTALQSSSSAPSGQVTCPLKDGGKVFTDKFDDLSKHQLPFASEAPDMYTAGYENGEYRVQTALSDSSVFATMWLAGGFQDSCLEIDTYFAGLGSGRFVALGCRRPSREQWYEYRFVVEPDNQQWVLVRYDGDADHEYTLTTWRRSEIIHIGNQLNKLELRCIGHTISGLVNGYELGSVEDDTYVQGWMWIGVGTVPLATADARLTSMTLTQH